MNETALVTGGSRGIGRAIAVSLATSCARTVIINYLQNDAEAEITRKEIEQQGSTCVLARANIAIPDEIDRLFEIIKASVEHLNIFVHCAALSTFGPILTLKPNQWDLAVNINARSFLLCVQKAVPLMKEGRIVAISSVGSQRALPNYGAMGPTKAALESTVRYLAAELTPRGIRVNGVSGGPVETDSVRRVANLAKLAEAAAAEIPAGRIGTPQDIADVVLFLVSPGARWICGQTIVADGGLSLF